jgi:hypothetical protein
MRRSTRIGLSTHVGKDVTHDETWLADGRAGNQGWLSPRLWPEYSRFVHTRLCITVGWRKCGKAVVRVPLTA